MHLILDECYCGLGASGKIYCCDYDKVTPDFIFVAKTLTAGHIPLSAVITKNLERKLSRNLVEFYTAQHFKDILWELQQVFPLKIIHKNKILQNITWETT